MYHKETRSQHDTRKLTEAAQRRLRDDPVRAFSHEQRCKRNERVLEMLNYQSIREAATLVKNPGTIGQFNSEWNQIERPLREKLTKGQGRSEAEETMVVARLAVKLLTEGGEGRDAFMSSRINQLSMDSWVMQFADTVIYEQRLGRPYRASGAKADVDERLMLLGVPEDEVGQISDMVIEARRNRHRHNAYSDLMTFPAGDAPEWKPFRVEAGRRLSKELDNFV